MTATTSQPDLTATNLALNNLTLSYQVANTGSASSAAAATGIFLSTDGTVTTADRLLTTVSAPALATGASDSKTVSLASMALPSTLAPGTYYIGVLADHNGQIVEGNEANNASTAAPLMLGSDRSNSMTGISGGDTMLGFAGNDTLNGAAGSDALDSGIGNDTLIGGTGADFLNGGSDIDWADYSASSAGIKVSLATGMGSGGDAQGDTLTNIENLRGSAFSDVLEGNGGNNRLAGRSGTDTLSYEHAGGGVTVSLATSVQVTGAAGTDTVSGFENLTGSAFNDVLTGSSAANVLVGLNGNDTLNGGSGADALIGGAGRDRLTGGSGNDFFQFNSALNAATNVDTVTDFNVAADTVQLENAIFTALGTTTGTLAAGQFFHGAAAHDADDRIIYNELTGALIYDFNGNAAGGASQFATLATGLGLTHADFVVI